MAEFEVDFNVETSNSVTYQNFIVNLRKQLGRITSRYSHQRPVLPIQEQRPTRWFDMVLQTKAHAIRPRIRLGNLYLDGYQMENPKQWLEFGNSNSYLIPGSKSLGFGGDYTDLANAAGQSMEDITVGQQQLKNAVNELAISTNRKDRAKLLIVVIMMICESLRFIPISDHLTSTYGNSKKILGWMKDLVHSWKDLSDLLLRADANPDPGPGKELILKPNKIRIPPNDKEVRRVVEAADILGILLGLCITPSALERVPSMAVNIGPCHKGRPLVEVFSVRINRIDGENPGHLYGTITVTDGLDSQYIYNRKKENPESIKPGNNALLTGPAQSISAYGSFTIKVLLTNKDHEVSNGEISRNVYDTTNEYDKPIFCNVDGKYGSVTVNYIVLSDAVAASVQVTLTKRDGKKPADVYGQLTATNGNVGDSKSVFFQKALNEHIKVSPGQLIPLSRSIVAVPLNSSLLVRANLYDHHVASSDAEIANGTAEFRAQVSGTIEKSISGKEGEIQVKVTWIWYY